MSGLLPFPDDDLAPERPAQAVRLAPKLKALAAQGIYLGGSSWKYEGWIGSIYSAERYLTRGKFSQKKFEAECLAEYAEVFPTVCGDFAFYQFPSPAYWQNLFGMTPASLSFGLKVPEDITVARWPKHARYGKRAGLENEHFLDVTLFTKLFARPLDPYRERVATLIFEFGTFAKSVFPKPEDFYERVDTFLGALPEGFRYSVEIRNEDYLRPEYLTMLGRHGVAHVLNAWTRMPAMNEQAALPGIDAAGFSVARALLPRGRSYEHAVAELSPYDAVKEASESAREGLTLVAEGARQRKKPAFLFVNNRLEGHAPTTIEAVADRLLTGF